MFFALGSGAIHSAARGGKGSGSSMLRAFFLPLIKIPYLQPACHTSHLFVGKWERHPLGPTSFPLCVVQGLGVARLRALGREMAQESVGQGGCKRPGNGNGFACLVLGQEGAGCITAKHRLEISRKRVLLTVRPQLFSFHVV